MKFEDRAPDKHNIKGAKSLTTNHFQRVGRLLAVIDNVVEGIKVIQKERKDFFLSDEEDCWMQSDGMFPGNRLGEIVDELENAYSDIRLGPLEKMEEDMKKDLDTSGKF